MEDTIINSVVPAAICELESESAVKDEPKVDVEAEPDTGGGCFDVLDMVEEPFDEAPTNYFSSDEEVLKMYSNDSSSESGSPDQSLAAVAVDDYVVDNQFAEADDVDMEEVFETIDGDSNDYDECYVAERPPSPADNPIPRGWKQVFHESGATIFVHLETNVCSLSRPYFLGSNSTKQHKLPTTPVPCLRYRSYLQNRHETVTECAAPFGSTTCQENTAPSAGGAVSDTNATCPFALTDSVTSETNAAVSDPNLAISESNPVISESNPVISKSNPVISESNPAIPDSNTTISESSPAISDSNPAIAESNPAISDSNPAISDANAVTGSENATTSIENTADSDMEWCPSTHLTVYTKNVPNIANAHASDANLIQFRANVATSTAATTADLANAIICDTNPNTCPVDASSYAESTVASAPDAAVLSQHSGTSDVIMTDVSGAIADPETFTSNVEATILDSNCHTSPLHATYAENAEKMNENAGISDSEELSMNVVSSDELLINSDENTVASISTSDAKAIVLDANAVTSNTTVAASTQNSPTLADNPAISSSNTISTAESATSGSSTNVIASTSGVLPAGDDTIEVASTKNMTASKVNAAPDDRTSSTEGASTRNDTIAADSAVAEEAQLLEYCKRLFKFKKIKYLKFRSWDVRRTYLRALRNERNRRRCPFSNNKVLSFPIETKDSDGNVVATKKWIINPRGRSYVAILHEYLQQSKKTQPEYKFTEVDNARNPYAATVVVNGTEYGTGFGMSKKDAKFEAAKATLEVLLPKMMKYVLSVCCNKTGNKKYEDYSDNEDDLQNVASAFDDIEIVDPRVTELSLQTTEPKPYELLLNCLQKKGEQPEVKFEFQAESMESTMAVGENKVTIKCGNKREGKQLAAQAMLQQLHPHVKNWGSLLRLYGNSITNQYRQVTDDKDVEELKCRPANKELLDTLRRRMSSLPDTDGEGAQVSSEQRYVE